MFGVISGHKIKPLNSVLGFSFPLISDTFHQRMFQAHFLTPTTVYRVKYVQNTEKVRSHLVIHPTVH